MASKKYATIDEKRCVACGACMQVCPRGAIEIWRGCHAVVNIDLCVGCGICAKTCPATCIEAVDRNREVQG